MLILIMFAFLAGVVTVLSPCVLPVLPILLSGTVGGRARPYGIVLGFILSFSFFTLFLSTLVRSLGLDPQVLRWVSIVLLAGFGLTLVVPYLHQMYEGVSSGAVQAGQKLTQRAAGQEGFLGGIGVGATLGLLWTPCVGPILASVITLAIGGTVTAQTALITLAFSLGTALPMLMVMQGGRALLQRVPWLLARLTSIQRGFGVLLMVFAVAMVFNLDRSVQTWVVEHLPSYTEQLSNFENNSHVQNALEQLQVPNSP